MENQSRNRSPKELALSVLFYILAVILLVTAGIALAACHQNISAQLEQGVPVKGNELAIVNLYLSSCVQYVALGAITAFCGSRMKKQAVSGAEAPEPKLLCTSGEPEDEDHSFETEQEDADFSEWGFQEKKNEGNQ